MSTKISNMTMRTATDAANGDSAPSARVRTGGTGAGKGGASSLQRRRKALKVLLYFLVGVIFIYTIFPFYWAINSSLKAGQDLFGTAFVPPDPAWGNYANVFKMQPFGRNILNSVVVASSTVGLSLLIGVLAAYSLARRTFRGRNMLLYTFLGVSMFPQIAVLSGLFELIRGLGLYNNWFGLTLAYMIFTLPFTIWVLTTFMREIPKGIEEAAIIDGAGPWTIVTRIFLPILGPALVTTGLLAFIAAWNEFLFALTFTLSDQARTVPVAIAQMSGSSQFELPWGNIMAASVVVTVPLVVLVLIFQRKIVAGLTAGSVKG